MKPRERVGSAKTSDGTELELFEHDGHHEIVAAKRALMSSRQHNSEEDCWIAINNKVYDLTDFAEEHPAGPESIIELAGQDGTEAFEAVHSEGILEDFDPVGTL